MLGRAKVFVLATCLSVAAATHASAFQASVFRPDALRDVPHATHVLQEGYARSAPVPFVVFCRLYAGECDPGGSSSTVTVSPEKFAQLTEINHRVNAAIRPQMMDYATHAWTLNANVGDCNEYAIQKRHDLLQAGWPAAAVALTIVKTPWGEGHLVVTVRTDTGDLVLDSLRSNIVAWDQTRYAWIMRQSASDPTVWVSLRGSGSSRTPHYHRRFPGNETIKVKSADVTGAPV